MKTWPLTEGVSEALKDRTTWRGDILTAFICYHIDEEGMITDTVHMFSNKTSDYWLKTVFDNGCIYFMNKYLYICLLTTLYFVTKTCILP